MVKEILNRFKQLLTAKSVTSGGVITDNLTHPDGVAPVIDITNLFPEKNVELVRKGDYVLFSPKSEQWKDVVYFDNDKQQWVKNNVISPVDYIKQRSQIQVKPKSYGDTRGLSWILAQYFMQNYPSFPILYFDVGGYVGNFTIETALLSQYENFDVEIFTFEPSALFPVLKKSIEINHLKPKINLLKMAISDVTGPILYSYQAGWFIGGHLGEAHSGVELSEICDSTTIDDFVEREKGFQLPHCFIIKLDCQGYEYQIYQGCQRLLETDSPVIFLSEFLSWSYTEQYQKFLDNFFVMDAKSHMFLQGVDLLESQDMPAFLERIKATESLTTDLILIPKKLKNAERLVSDILSKSKC
ncbi:MAG: FkbM family methyltransferase [Leptolyngbyaceae cyanobacterium bins.349]|nr:FkbM family methyltransferase [Leptolyngbyaceae cyanobacterium bins.349]